MKAGEAGALPASGHMQDEDHHAAPPPCAAPQTSAELTQEHAASFSTFTLRLVSSKSLNGGMPAHLDRTRRRSAPTKSSATSLPKVAARSSAVVTSSRWQTGIGHVFH